MTVGRDYMLEKPSGPSAPKLFLDTKVVPAVVNVAGAFEVALDRASVRTGVRPALILAGMVGVASIAIVALLPGLSRGRSRRTPSRAAAARRSPTPR